MKTAFYILWGLSVLIDWAIIAGIVLVVLRVLGVI
jgi:hypothetical protein